VSNECCFPAFLLSYLVRHLNFLIEVANHNRRIYWQLNSLEKKLQCRRRLPKRNCFGLFCWVSRM
jgi:hypothetical protein